MQEERQRSRERAESEAECAAGGRGDMPVARILEAELAVEPKTESYGDVNVESSVGAPRPAPRPPPISWALDRAADGQGVSGSPAPARSVLCSSSR